MSVITMNNPSSLRVKLDAGLNDSTGNTIVKSKTYSNLKSERRYDRHQTSHRLFAILL